MKKSSINLFDHRWRHAQRETSRFHLNGQAYLDDNPVNADALAMQLDVAQTPDALKAALTRLNGFYAWIEQTPGRIRAAVDHIRSRPLFYACLDGDFYLSDHAEWVRQQVGDREMDPIAREEFQLAGYVTGADTLFSRVKQLQAGECLVATQSEDGARLQTHRYYRFRHTEPDHCDRIALREALDRAAVSSIQRLIDYANGRQIVVPLSGGYDSRLIVTLLKRLGYENILTFTYGVPGNKESAYSKRAADSLGLRWHFVEYSEALWREAWATDEHWAYQKWASGWASIAHVQDWLAVKIMRQEGVPEPDCLFVPGHCCVTGLIPADIFGRQQISKQKFLVDLTRRHFSLAPLDGFALSKNGRILQYVGRFAPRETLFSADMYVRYFMEFGWQERQAKFICNSVRVYEFFGYEWWMPLWDRNFMTIWELVPMEFRRGRHWYVDYVQTQHLALVSSANSAQLGNASDLSRVIVFLKKIQSILRLTKSTALKDLARRLVGQQSNHTDLLSLRYDASKRAALFKKGYLGNGLAAQFFLDDLNARGF